MSEKDKEILNEAVNETENGINEEQCEQQEAAEQQETTELTAEEKLQKELDEANE